MLLPPLRRGSQKEALHKASIDALFTLGLPLVVALLPDLRIYGGLLLRLLRPLLREQTGYRGRHQHLPLLRVHLHHGVPFLLIDRLDLLLVYQHAL